jgi:hypothetical protein
MLNNLIDNLETLWYKYTYKRLMNLFLIMDKYY